MASKRPKANRERYDQSTEDRTGARARSGEVNGFPWNGHVGFPAESPLGNEEAPLRVLMWDALCRGGLSVHFDDLRLTFCAESPEHEWIITRLLPSSGVKAHLSCGRTCVSHRLDLMRVSVSFWNCLFFLLSCSSVVWMFWYFGVSTESLSLMHFLKYKRHLKSKMEWNVESRGDRGWLSQFLLIHSLLRFKQSFSHNSYIKWKNLKFCLLMCNSFAFKIHCNKK